MPLSIEEQKERQKISRKKYRDANKEKEKEYRIANKDKIKEADKKYRDANKEKIKEYRIANKEKIKEHNKEYNQTQAGKKTKTISSWKNVSKIFFKDKQEVEFYYNTYINTHRCTWCNIDFKNSRDRHLDHCHTCCLPRAIICLQCNLKDEVPCVNCLL